MRRGLPVAPAERKDTEKSYQGANAYGGVSSAEECHSELAALMRLTNGELLSAKLSCIQLGEIH